jgi:hypothetical protein
MEMIADTAILTGTVGILLALISYILIGRRPKQY